MKRIRGLHSLNAGYQSADQKFSGPSTQFEVMMNKDGGRAKLYPVKVFDADMKLKKIIEVPELIRVSAAAELVWLQDVNLYPIRNFKHGPKTSD